MSRRTTKQHMMRNLGEASQRLLEVKTALDGARKEYATQGTGKKWLDALEEGYAEMKSCKDKMNTAFNDIFD